MKLRILTIAAMCGATAGSLPANAEMVTSIGEPAPDFELPNHRGEMVSFHADRDGARAALIVLTPCTGSRPHSLSTS